MRDGTEIVDFMRSANIGRSRRIMDFIFSHLFWGIIYERVKTINEVDTKKKYYAKIERSYVFYFFQLGEAPIE